MADERIELEVEKTMASLDEVQRCRSSGSFAERVLSSITLGETAREEGKTAGWWPDLALAMVILLILLDGAAMAWSLKANEARTRSRIMCEISGAGAGESPLFSLTESLE